MIRQFMNEETIDVPSDFQDYSYDQIVGTTFKLVNSSDFYEYDSQYKVWKDKTDNASYMKKLVENGETIRIVGVVQPRGRSSSFFPESRHLLSGITDQVCGRAGSRQ